MNYIRVTNGTDKVIKGRYDGQDYLFQPGKPLDVPEIVATHVFAFDRDDKMSALARLGWLSTSDQIEAAEQKLQLISMETVEMRGHVIDEELPADTASMVPDQIGAVSPNTNAGGFAGGVLKTPPNGPIKGVPPVGVGPVIT